MVLICLTSLSLVAGAAQASTQTQTPPPPPPAQAAPAPAPLPVGARIAFVNLDVIFSQSDLGRQGQERWRQLSEKLFAGLSAREKEITGLGEKIQAQQGLIDATVLRQWNLDLARLQREAQFAQEDAQAQSQQLQQEVLADFEKQIRPVIDAIRTELKLDAILAVQDEPGGLTLISFDPGVDLSGETVRRLNAKGK